MVPREVEALPRQLRELWLEEYRRLRGEAGRGAREAEALAWRVFRRPDRRPARGDDRAWEAVVRCRIWGGTPEWLRLLEEQRENRGEGLLVDRRALAAILWQWEERGSDLLIGGVAAGFHPPFILPEVAGWIRDLEVREGCLWGRLEWTEPLLALLEAPGSGEWWLEVGFGRDASGRPVALQRARLENRRGVQGVAGFEMGIEGW